jgi:hypothetical protein
MRRIKMVAVKIKTKSKEEICNEAKASGHKCSRKDCSTKSKLFSEYSIKELKDEFSQYHNILYICGGYGVKDVMIYEAICNELERRGYTLETDTKIVKVRK